MQGSIASYLLGHYKYLVEFLVWNKSPYLHQNLIPFISPSSYHLLISASIFHDFISSCTHLRELTRNKKDNNKVFWMAKRYLLVIIILLYPETELFSSCWGLKGKHVFIFLFWILGNERETLKRLKHPSKAIY